MPPRRKRLLFLEFTSDYAKPYQHIERICELHGCEVVHHQFDGIDNLSDFLRAPEHAGRPFDVLYVGAHGNDRGIGTEDEHLIRWADFADHVCGSPGLTTDTVLYLGCCYGGVALGAQVLMTRCNTINYVAGLPCVLNASDAVVAFTTFMHWDRKRASATRIRDAVGGAVAEDFSFYCRYDMSHIITTMENALHSGQLVPDAFLSQRDLDAIAQARAADQSAVPVLN